MTDDSPVGVETRGAVSAGATSRGTRGGGRHPLRGGGGGTLCAFLQRRCCSSPPRSRARRARARRRESPPPASPGFRGSRAWATCSPRRSATLPTPTG